MSVTHDQFICGCCHHKVYELNDFLDHKKSCVLSKQNDERLEVLKLSSENEPMVANSDQEHQTYQITHKDTGICSVTTISLVDVNTDNDNFHSVPGMYVYHVLINVKNTIIYGL